MEGFRKLGPADSCMHEAASTAARRVRIVLLNTFCRSTPRRNRVAALPLAEQARDRVGCPDQRRTTAFAVLADRCSAAAPRVCVHFTPVGSTGCSVRSALRRTHVRLFCTASLVFSLVSSLVVSLPVCLCLTSAYARIRRRRRNHRASTQRIHSLCTAPLHNPRTNKRAALTMPRERWRRQAPWRCPPPPRWGFRPPR
jgi:hypothetical protein